MLEQMVALLAEGVDRNRYVTVAFVWSKVALLAEGVDRNKSSHETLTRMTRSPSSRRAWIEICWFLLLEMWMKSPSSRRAWIEISPRGSPRRRRTVALLAEGVDRNTHGMYSFQQSDESPSSRRAWIEIP